MSNERPDNEFHWREKLEAPEGVSPEPWVGKDAAWEKLYSRLHEKPGRRFPVWYWAAAVCLLFVLYLAVRPGGQGVSAVSKLGQRAVKGSEGGAARGNEGAATISKGAMTIERAATGSEGGATINERIVRVGGGAARGGQNMISRRSASAGKAAVKSSGSGSFPAIKDPVPTIAVVQVGTMLNADTATLASLIVPPVRKKLRVVHLNELPDPAAEASNLADNTGARDGDTGTNEGNNKSGNNRRYTGYTRQHPVFGGTSFFRLIRPRDPVISNTTASAGNFSYELLKIKLSQKN